MEKVVINDSYGCFGLSTKAIEYMISKGLEEKYYKVNKDYDQNKKENEFNPKYFFETYDIPRHHPLLVEAVEVLGKEANGMCASLKVQDVCGNLYRITEFDGAETIETLYNPEWININEL